MSLATGLAHDGVRPASFLPTIKCSDCAEELEIAEMGNHVCASSVPSLPPPYLPKGHATNMSNPFVLRQMDVSDSHQLETSLPKANIVGQYATRSPPISSSPKSPRPSLPKINPEATSAPFLTPGIGTIDSPLSPAASTKFGSSNNNNKPSFPRTLTSPAPHLYDPRPPSPELSANLDCAFPPFPPPASSTRRPSMTSNGRKTPTGSECAPSRGASRLDQVLVAEPEPLDLEPKSPRLNGGENVLQRMRTLHAGPFNMSRRGSDDPKDGTLRTNSRQASSDDARTAQTSNNFPYTSSASTSQVYIESDSARTKIPNPHPTIPTEEVHSSSFLGQLSAEPASLMPSSDERLDNGDTAERSNTFPMEGDSTTSKWENTISRTLSKMPSEPGLRSANMRPYDLPATSSPSFIPKSQLPPRKDSATGTRVDYRIHNAPPIPKAVQEYKQEGIHTPSDSGSSMMSMTNSTSVSNVGSMSPVESVASGLDTFLPPNLNALQYGDEEKMGEGAPRLKNSMQPGIRAEQPIQRSPSRKFTRPPRSHEMSPKAEIEPSTPLESPMDPLLQQMRGQLTQQPPREGRPPLSRTKTAPGIVPRTDAPVPSALRIPSVPTERRGASESSSPGVSRARNASADSEELLSADQQPRKATPRRTMNTKATCRGCGQAIEGKAVKAADGRLTGRWHKGCFVCRCCKEPFTTADFYVINNEPYCEYHYHETNGSLCSGCNLGIEGQYLETSSSTRFGSIDKKFHPRCFTCTTCRVVLAEDYFEITNRVFCERHALAAMRAQARLAPGLHPPDRPGLTAERRTTRLINPMMA